MTGRRNLVDDHALKDCRGLELEVPGDLLDLWLEREVLEERVELVEG